jgi:hypothetical protein
LSCSAAPKRHDLDHPAQYARLLRLLLQPGRQIVDLLNEFLDPIFVQARRALASKCRAKNLRKMVNNIQDTAIQGTVRQEMRMEQWRDDPAARMGFQNQVEEAIRSVQEAMQRALQQNSITLATMAATAPLLLWNQMLDVVVGGSYEPSPVYSPLPAPQPFPFYVPVPSLDTLRLRLPRSLHYNEDGEVRDTTSTTTQETDALAGQGLHPLSNEELESLRDAMDGSKDPTETLAEYNQTPCCRGDLQTLLPNCWVNDAVLNFYFQTLMQPADTDGCPLGHIYSSLFFTRLLNHGHKNKPGEYDYEGVKQWSKAYGECRFVGFIPSLLRPALCFCFSP